jgi:flagellar hook assembly protein FlgD
MLLVRPLILALVCAFVLAAPATASVRLVERDVPLSPLVAARAFSAEPVTLRARAAPLGFDLVGLHWRGTGRVWFRTARLGGRWSGWHPAAPEAEDLPNRSSREARAHAGWQLGSPWWTGAARRIQIRTAGSVTRVRVAYVASPVTPQLHARDPAAAPSQPAIITRKQWGANESIVRGSPSYASRVAFAVVHHTAGGTPTTRAQSAAMVRAIEVYHVRSNGWNDIGYNFLVDPFGQVFEGRRGGIARNVIGAHAQGFNTGSVGVATLGTYSSAKASPAAATAIANLLAWRLDLAHVDPTSRLVWTSLGSPKYPPGTAVNLAAVSGHRDTGLTECPGTALWKQLPAIAATALATGGPKIFEPKAIGALGSSIRFTARLSAELPWTVEVWSAAGTVVASGAGTGAAVDWSWNSVGAAVALYTYVISVGPDVRPATGTVGEPPLSLSTFGVAPAVFTPNGDKVADRAQITLRVSKPALVALSLENGAGAKVATITTAKALAAGRTTIAWAGRDGTGKAVSDGAYTLVAQVSSGPEHLSRSAKLTLDRTLGSLAASPSPLSPNGDGRRESAAVSFKLQRAAAVTVRVFSGSKAVGTLLSARKTAGTVTLQWDGRVAGAPLRDGAYRIRVDASAGFGTRALSVPLVLDRAAPKLRILSARRERRGTRVRLQLNEPAAVVLTMGRITLRFQARAGVTSIWRRVRPASVSASAKDAADNQGKKVSAAVQRS